MARNKIKLQYISNDAIRRRTLRKRCSSILKNVQELGVLCGVDVCGIIFIPKEAAPQVWPQPEDARHILRTFNSRPEVERTRKMTNHLAFMQERVVTLRDKVATFQNDDAKLEVRVILNEGFLGSDFDKVILYDLWAADYALNDLISKVYGKICTMSLPLQAPIGGMAVGPVAKPAAGAPAAPTARAIGETGPSTRVIRHDDGGELLEEMGDFGSCTGGSEDDSTCFDE